MRKLRVGIDVFDLDMIRTRERDSSNCLNLASGKWRC
jgi:hypothetical protein